MGDFSTFAGLGGSGVPPDLTNLGFSTSGGVPGVDLQQLLNDLNLTPQPLVGPPPVDTTGFPVNSPLPIDVGLPLPPELPPNPVFTSPFNPPQPLSPTGTPSGYPLIGPPTFTVTSTTPTITETPPPPPQPITQPPPVTVTTSGGGGSVTVNVQVNNAENIANDVIRQLQDAITQGITNSVQAASDVAKGVFSQIADALKNVFTTIWDTLKNVLQAIAGEIGRIVVGIGDALKNAAEYIFKGLGQIFGNLRDVLIDVINKIGPTLLKIAQTVDNINRNLITPIANFINTTVRTIAALTVAIEKDLHDGLSGIIRIPGDIAQGIQSLDSSLNRTVQQIGQFNKQVAVDTFFHPDGTNLAQNVRGISDGLVGISGKTQADTTFASKDQLSPDCNLDTIASQVAGISTDLSNAPDWLKWFAKAAIAVLVAASEVEAYIAKSVEAAEEAVNRKCPIKKLDSGTLVQAWVRNFIDGAQMDDELAAQGIGPDRSKLLRDLSRYVESSQDLAEYRYRNIISDDDFVNGLRILGYTDSQISAYRSSTQKLLDVQTATTALQRGQITTDTFAATLAANRYDPEQAQLLQTLAFRPADPNEALSGTLQRTFIGSTFGNVDQLDTPPDWYVTASKSVGLNDDVTRLNWWTHFFTGDVQTWLNLYFRGVRTIGELTNFFDSRGIPREFQGDIIESARPLLPFRSLPTYVKAGVISDAYARSVLQAHGFHLQDINAVMDLIGSAGKSTKSKAAGGILTLSIANAKTLFNDGAITQAQYEGILVQHGYTAELATAQAEVDSINAHARTRKATLANYAAEVEAGVLSLDDAVTQLVQQGFTTAEIQPWQGRVLRALRIGTHRPTLGELGNYLKNGLITLDAYRQELVNQNWQEPWLTAQVTLVTPK